VALTECMRFLTERRTWFCLVQRDRKSAYAPVGMKRLALSVPRRGSR
jgi:hypothetical protein